MSTKLTCSLLVLAILVGLLAGPGVAQTYIKTLPDGSPIPDVNKPGVVGGGGGANPADLSCWEAAAANLLGAAGYGTGPTAQMRADGIYNTLRADLGWSKAGSSEYAINYWLYEYGKNPDSAEFKPTNSYTDVTVVERSLGATDYTFLLSELQRCQYVEVSFTEPGHCMTMVGGASNTVSSVWHDSDWNAIPPGNDSYLNDFSSGWSLKDQLNQTVYAQADGYVTLCPGLNKPESAMRNYDLAYFLTDNEKYTQGATPRDGFWTAEFREAGLMKNTFDDPFWMENNTVVHLDNEADPNKQKEISLLVDFFDRNIVAASYPIQLRYMDANGQVLVNPTVTPSADGGQLLYKWELDTQPAWEEIVFPSAQDFCFLEGAVKDWDVAVVCVPEPATLSLLALGGLAVLRRRKSAKAN